MLIRDTGTLCTEIKYENITVLEVLKKIKRWEPLNKSADWVWEGKFYYLLAVIYEHFTDVITGLLSDLLKLLS